MKVSALKRLPVVSMADGATVGVVEEALLDTTSLRVASLLLAGGGGHAVLPFARVRSIGPDAVTIEHATATHGAVGVNFGEAVRRLGELSGLQVVNADGSRLGEVRDFEFDRADGRLAVLLVHEGGIFGLGGSDRRVPATAIRAVGRRLVTVDVPADTEDSEPELPPARYLPEATESESR